MAKKTFEQAMKQLEQIVEELESGELSLEKALNRFEEGVKLSRYCAATLDETERKVTLLLKDAEGGLVEMPFAAGEEDA